MEWQVWLADGSTRTSLEGAWNDLPDGIQVVRVWWPDGSMSVNWGDGIYGDPATWKQAAIIEDDRWERIFAEAQAMRTKPSEQ